VRSMQTPKIQRTEILVYGSACEVASYCAVTQRSESKCYTIMYFFVYILDLFYSVLSVAGLRRCNIMFLMQRHQ